MARILFRGVTAGFVLLGAAAGTAAVPTGLPEPVEIDATPGAMNIGQGAAAPPSRAATDQVQSGNPLWAIPLKELAVTRERPLFSPARRPPAPAVAAAPYVLASVVTPPAPPERPQLSLVGTIAGDSESFAIFLDQSANKPMRLKLGDSYKGWTLRDIRRRDIVFQKDEEAIVLALPVSSAGSPAGAAQLAEDVNNRRGRR